MKRTLLLLVVLCRFAGCGLHPLTGSAACVGDGPCTGNAEVNVVPAVGSDTVTTPVATADPFTTTEVNTGGLTLDPLSLLLLSSDSLLFTLFDPLLDPNLLSAFVDQASLDLIGPRSMQSSFSFLERQCIQLGVEEFICRQRYGN